MQNHDYLTYEGFGRRFFEVAVTPERVAAAFADIAGSEFAMEPIAQGPGGIAKVSANVKIEEPQVTRHLGDAITFVIHIPLSIDLLLDLRLDKRGSACPETSHYALLRARPSRCCSSLTSPAAAIRYHCQRVVKIAARGGATRPRRCRR